MVVWVVINGAARFTSVDGFDFVESDGKTGGGGGDLADIEPLCSGPAIMRR